MRVNIDDTDRDDALRYIYDGAPFTGEIEETDRAGNVIALLNVRNGIQEGPELSWYADGTLETESTFVDGGIVGTSRAWHPNGQLADERVFDDRGHLVQVRSWAADGTVESTPARR